MDEIDAALDFRNVSIVANYIKERTRNAQFIIISLRNNMFELADRLVGIYKTDNCAKSIAINPAAFTVPTAPMGDRTNAPALRERDGMGEGEGGVGRLQPPSRRFVRRCVRVCVGMTKRKYTPQEHRLPRHGGRARGYIQPSAAAGLATASTRWRRWRRVRTSPPIRIAAASCSGCHRGVVATARGARLASGRRRDDEEDEDGGDRVVPFEVAWDRHGALGARRGGGQLG